MGKGDGGSNNQPLGMFDILWFDMVVSSTKKHHFVEKVLIMLFSWHGLKIERKDTKIWE